MRLSQQSSVRTIFITELISTSVRPVQLWGGIFLRRNLIRQQGMFFAFAFPIRLDLMRHTTQWTPCGNQVNDVYWRWTRVQVRFVWENMVFSDSDVSNVHSNALVFCRCYYGRLIPTLKVSPLLSTTLKASACLAKTLMEWIFFLCS